MQTNYNSIFTDEKRLDIFFDAGLFPSSHITYTSKKSLVYFVVELLVYLQRHLPCRSRPVQGLAVLLQNQVLRCRWSIFFYI